MPDFLTHADWTFPVPMRYGPGRLVEIGDFCVQNNIANPLIVTDRGSRDLPFIERVSDSSASNLPRPIGVLIQSCAFFESRPRAKAIP